VLTARLHGEIDHHSVTAVRMHMDDELMREKPKKLVIDVGKVDFMDSSGLGLIMGRLAKIREYGGTLEIANASPRTVKMLKMAGLDRLIVNERNTES
jgi:stage II sporulation protein AA (anti-sigma F factor antagonist)